MINYWETLEEGTTDTHGLAEIAKSRNSPDLTSQMGLLVAIVIQAAKDRDYDFFAEGMFYELCKITKLDPDVTYDMFKEVWKLEDDNQSE